MRSKITVLISTALFLIACPPALAGSFEDTGFIDNDAYSQSFKDFKARKFFSTVLVAREIQGRLLFRGQFEAFPEGSFSFRALRKMSGDSFAQRREKYAREGFMLLWHQAAERGDDRVVHQAVWVKGKNPITACLERRGFWYHGRCNKDEIGLIPKSPSAPAQLSWSVDQLEHFSSNCANAIVAESLTAYRERVAAAGNDPEQGMQRAAQLLHPPVRAHCDCLLERISSDWDVSEYLAREEQIANTYVAEALQGGACQFGGFLKAVVSSDR